MNTKPTIEPVLERIDALATQMAEMRREMHDRFDNVERKIALLNNDFLTLRAQNDRQREQMDGLRRDVDTLLPTKTLR